MHYGARIPSEPPNPSVLRCVRVRERETEREREREREGECVCVCESRPFSFEGGLWRVSHRDHLLPRPHPHDRPVVTLRRALQPQAGERSPWQCPLRGERTDTFSSLLAGNCRETRSILPCTRAESELPSAVDLVSPDLGFRTVQLQPSALFNKRLNQTM